MLVTTALVCVLGSGPPCRQHHAVKPSPKNAFLARDTGPCFSHDEVAACSDAILMGKKSPCPQRGDGGDVRVVCEFAGAQLGFHLFVRLPGVQQGWDCWTVYD